MFGGIISCFCEIKSVERKPGLYTLGIELTPELAHGVEIGASIAVDGVCLTVTGLDNNRVFFDVISETIRVTTLAQINSGDFVNIERSLISHNEIGGHLISGHVDCTAIVAKIDRPQNNWTVVLQVKEQWMKYIFPKGFIALNGVSLTIGFVDREKNQFAVYLIPETLRRTTFSKKTEGSLINLEVERQTQTIVDTMQMFLEGLERKILAGTAPKNILESLIPALTGNKTKT